jgi:valyl-tRNA synthetase
MLKLPKGRILGKSYEPKHFESEIYQFWMENGCFEASDENAEGQAAFCIMIPPPNVTGSLHIGHALTNTIQDILIRWRRMKGDNTLWLPGTDHAGIATQTQVEKQIAKEGKGPSGRPLTRHDLGREKFLERTWKWKEEHGSQIGLQLRRLGSSLDWSRERFTLDEGLSRAVREVFVRLYEQGLIYRANRMINWCPKDQTALSDLEVLPEERKGSLWVIRYEVVDLAGKPLPGAPEGKSEVVIATTRPETLLGDTAVALHPEDERFEWIRAVKGARAVVPLVHRKVPIIFDEYVDREFGTGALKVTPAHDFHDYDLGVKHHLELLVVLGKDGRMNTEAGPYQGLKSREARERIVQDLEAAGKLVRVEPHTHQVGVSQRSGEVVEPMPSTQWFVKIEPLAKPAIAAVESGQITFTPKSWEKTYFEWMYHIRDWCISRQLWWGHQIPAWFCSKCDGITVSRTDPSACQHCSADSSSLKQDEDVLDTWFSSALWPFSTLGWPDQTKALKTFYPTSILETGFDIIFFWVARMIMMGLHFMGEVPFRKVYLHAMVRDEKGEKMSKTKGNVIDPLVVIDQHGADSLRFTLAAMAGQGRDIKLSLDRVEGYRAFANKLWNAVKFFHLHAEGSSSVSWGLSEEEALSLADRWILSRLERTRATVEQSFEKFELQEASQALYRFVWLELCDWYIEFSKEQLQGSAKTQTLRVLHEVLETTLRLLHPIMPFVTEELWQSLPGKKAAQTPARILQGKAPIQTLMLQTFPLPQAHWLDEEAEKAVGRIQRFVDAIRNFRGENQVSPKIQFPVWLKSMNGTEAELGNWVREMKASLLSLSRVAEIHLGVREQGGRESLVVVAEDAMEIRIPLEGLVNVEEEVSRLKKEIEKAQKDQGHSQRKLDQPTFLEKAPLALIEKEREMVRQAAAKIQELESALAKLQSST